MPPAAKRPYHHGDLRNALLVEAQKTVAAGGAAELSLRAVAKAAGVAPAAVYRHFADKRALRSACAADGFDRMVATIQARIATAPQTPMRRFRAVGEGYLAFALAEPHLFRLMFARDLTDRTDPALATALARLRELTGAGLAALDAETLELRTLSWSVVHGLAMLAIDGQIDAVLDGAKDGAKNRAHDGAENGEARVAALAQVIRHIGPALEGARPR